MARQRAGKFPRAFSTALFALKFASIAEDPVSHNARNSGSQYAGTLVCKGQGEAITVAHPRLQMKLADVREKIENLQKLERELGVALRSCDKELRKRDAHCPILQDKDTKIEEGRR